MDCDFYKIWKSYTYMHPFRLIKDFHPQKRNCVTLTCNKRRLALCLHAGIRGLRYTYMQIKGYSVTLTCNKNLLRYTYMQTKLHLHAGL